MELNTFACFAETENQKKSTNPNKDCYRGLMFANPGDSLCPGKSYITKCPPDATSFYIHPLKAPREELDRRKFPQTDGCELSRKHTSSLQQFVLSKRYTNHSLRSTTVQILSEAGLESRKIMSVTGHKCETSLRSY